MRCPKGRSKTYFKVKVHSSSAPAGKQDYESQPKGEAATTTNQRMPPGKPYTELVRFNLYQISTPLEGNTAGGFTLSKKERHFSTDFLHIFSTYFL
jgi:hypothetical protein